MTETTMIACAQCGRLTKYHPNKKYCGGPCRSRAKNARIPSRLSKLEKAARDVVNAWESLPGDRRYPANEISAWLVDHMAPAVNGVRELLK